MNHSKLESWKTGRLDREVIRVTRIAMRRGVPLSVLACSNSRPNLQADGWSLGKL